MVVEVKYFGAVAEAIGKPSESLELEGELLVAELRALLERRCAALGALTYQVSVNRKLTSTARLSDGDEVAVLPPFAGG